jgi:Xaa-Pro aminopeptidase
MPVVSLRELGSLSTFFAESSPIGLAGDNLLPVSRHATILEHLQNGSVLPRSGGLVPAGDLLYTMRMRKNAEEIERMAWAAWVDDEALRYTLRHVKAGMTEIQVAGLAEYAGHTGFWGFTCIHVDLYEIVLFSCVLYICID